MSNWQVILLEPATTILSQIGQFIVNILLVLIILLIGWTLSKLIKALVTKGLRAVKLDQLSDRIELDSLLAKGGIDYSLSELIGVICYWLGLLVTFVVAINAIGLTIAADLLNRVILYVPNVIAAIFILIAGMFVATIMRNIVQTTSINAGIAQDKLLGKLVEVIVLIFTLAIVLEQLNIGAKLIELTISILLASLGLGIALAFGLGCKDIAARFVSDLIEKVKTRK
ncbi:MAG TPA: hypothetical protein VMD52_05935 [Patescibacteria group bacterium]|nr:hypothetical protein [Patescibacteria group bacterium]